MGNLKFGVRSVPLALLLLCIVSFGLLIPWLGYYWDDWPVILMTRLQGAQGFWNFYQYDRPFSAWTYILSAPILGSSPLPWHIFTLLLRWGTVLGMWWSLMRLWPNRVREVTWIAFLFAIYPSFLQQPVAVAFSQHWITYALFFLSIGCMIQAIRSPRWFLPLTIASLATCALHLFTMEYFIGLELLRPALLWIILLESISNTRQRLIKTVKLWLPYLATLGLFIIWRAFFLKLAGDDPNSLSLLNSFSSQPLPAAINFLQLAVQDFIQIIAGAWTQTINPALVSLTSSFFLITVLASIIGALLAGLYLYRLKIAPPGNKEADHWRRQAISLGLAAIFLGFLPVWVTDRGAIEGLYGSRFTLGAMFGISVFLIGILDWFTPRQIPKIILLSLLVGIAINFHLTNTNDYRWSWINQKRFYWQLHWRAPAIKPDTAIISDGELFPFVGLYSTSTALNLLYPQPEGQDTLAYWFYSMGRGLFRQIPALLDGKKLKTSFRTFNFNGNSKDSLVIYYEPSEGRCLWVLSPEDQELSDLPELTLSILPVSNLDRIQTDASSQANPPTQVFGAELEHTWCYYFQKADLARQMGDWKQILALGKEARGKGFETDHFREVRPFIEAYAQTGDWGGAAEWTLQVNPKGNNVVAVCKLWSKLVQSTPASDQKRLAMDKVSQSFQCSP
jgi:hypothetical protein